MPTGPAFTLDVETDSSAGIVRVLLTDEQGRRLGANQVRFADHSLRFWQGLFDTGAYVRSYTGSMYVADRTVTASDLLEQIGVFLGQKVLGSEVTAALHAGRHHRSLLVRQPEALKDGLAAAFARVPWEIARPAAGQGSLLARNLVVRMEMPGTAVAYTPPPPGADETLRVLLVYAEVPGSRPLAMRLEREQLLELFYDDVMPQRQVEVDVLCHGVTRESLRKKLLGASGYHVVHWSGHGHHNLLELLGEDGEPDLLTGSELVDLFADSGGFIPRLVFLSACLSGRLEAAPQLEKIEDVVADQPGYTGTALALLDAGVPQVVAMRYEVGDAYARDLAGLFYRGLFADASPKTPAIALSLARSEFLKQRALDYDPVDHATPLLVGRDMGAMPTLDGRSPALSLRRPQPQPILTDSHELDRPAELVGRGQPLSRLRECLEEGRPAVALVQGLAGLGKTALVAEAVHLWHHRFYGGVFAFQAKPLPLGLDDFLLRLDLRLAVHSKIYRELCEKRPNAAIYLPLGKPLSGEARWRQMRDNLLEAMRNERLLLVLDNFETNLEKVAGEDGYACADPEWDRLLRHLVEGLSGSGSRLLVTSRHRLAALASTERASWLRLGPLPMAEAELFLQGTEPLRRLAHGDVAGRELALRLLGVSRGHPLILALLGALAGDRKVLVQALDELESKGLNRLPDVFAPHLSDAEREKELAYLEDVAIGAVDLLIQRTSPDARRLLWLVTLAFEPVTERMIQGVWSGRSWEEEFGDGAALPPVYHLLAELETAGLLAVERERKYWWHELIRERVVAWMEAHTEKGERTEEQVWMAYGERYAALTEVLLRSGREGTREWALEAGLHGLSYLIQARDFAQLSPIASRVVSLTRDPRILGQVAAELERAIEQVPSGKARWNLKTNRADAMRQAGRPDVAIQFYEQALQEAEAAESWADVGWIGQNLAIALRSVGRLNIARDVFLRVAEIGQRTGTPRVNILASEIEVLRIDLMKGRAEQVLNEIENRIQEIRTWWFRHQAGELVPEAPDIFLLANVLMAGLGIALDANLELERWNTSLMVLDEMEETSRASDEGDHELARTRCKRYGPLLALGRFDEAQMILEECLAVDREEGDFSREASDLSALADLWSKRGDVEKAVGLERQALAAHSRSPALEERSKAHGNLAIYLAKQGTGEEAVRHLLAAIIYSVIMGDVQSMVRASQNLILLLRGNTDPGTCYELPRVVELLARPEFEPLQWTLTEWNGPLDELQESIDVLMNVVRRQSLKDDPQR